MKQVFGLTKGFGVTRRASFMASLSLFKRNMSMEMQESQEINMIPESVAFNASLSSIHNSKNNNTITKSKQQAITLPLCLPFRHPCTIARTKNSKNFQKFLLLHVFISCYTLLLFDTLYLYTNIRFYPVDKDGRTRRFYRQVFINEITSNHPNFNDHKPLASLTDPNNDSNNDSATDIKSNSRWTINLDNRLLISNERAIILDSYKLALAIALELESQSEYMRCESMPITETICSYFDTIEANMIKHIELVQKHGNTKSVAFYDDMQRVSWRGSVATHFENDLLKICENEDLYNQGFYTNNWQPIIDWFNETFNSQVEMERLFMRDEEAPLSEYAKLGSDFSGLLDVDSQSVINNFKRTAIAKKLDYFEEKAKEESESNVIKKKKETDMSHLRKYLSSLDSVRLWMIDNMIQYCYSPIIAVALVCNAFSLEHVLKCINVCLLMCIYDQCN